MAPGWDIRTIAAWTEKRNPQPKRRTPGDVERARVQRSTVSLGAWVRLEVKERARADAIEKGYGERGLSEYVADLIMGQNPSLAKPAGPAQVPALVGARVLHALAGIDERVRAGADSDELRALRVELQGIRGDIAGSLHACMAAYEQRVEDRFRDDTWRDG